MVIIFQCISVSFQHILHLKPSQCYICHLYLNEAEGDKKETPCTQGALGVDKRTQERDCIEV